MAPSTRRLNQLWKRKMSLEVRVNLLIKRRLNRFRRGVLSSEDFERATGPERNLNRVNEQIAKIEKRLRGSKKGFCQLLSPTRTYRSRVKLVSRSSGAPVISST